MEKKKKLIILGVILLLIIVSGATFAILTWNSTMIKLGINTNCFTIDYTRGGDITGSLKLLNINELFAPPLEGSDNPQFTIKKGMGLSYVNVGINSNCSIEGYGTIYLNVTELSDTFKEGGESNGALGYAVLKNTSSLSNSDITIDNLDSQSFEVLNIQSIVETGKIELYSEQLSNTEVNKYLVVIFVDKLSAGNNVTEATFKGNISVEANQKNTSITPDYCFNLVEKDEENKTASIGGVLYNGQYLGLGYKCYEGNEEGYETITDVIIPEKIDGYTIIGIKGFTFRKAGLTSVVIPSTVVSIGVSNSGQTYYGAFEENKISEITIPDSVTTIEKQAFKGNKIKKVIIPASVTSIGASPFMGNNTLEEIVVDENNPTYDSRDNSNAIIETSTNTLIQGCKNTTIPNTITNIDRAAFLDMSLTSMIIPDSVTTIGYFAFQSNQLTSISLPDSVTEIRSYAFSDNNLNYVYIGSDSNLTSIGSKAFTSSTNSNPNLKTIYYNGSNSLPWIYAVNGSDSSTRFVTGTVPSYTIETTTYNEVLITTGK